jgi:glycosyltransferase involved in cell wall biosynthesis
MSEKDITVIVPTYNHESLICLAIESIVRQSIFSQCQVVISDDCSTDRTHELAQKAAKNHSNILVRRNPKTLGVMDHYQSLASEIKTTFTAILEGDDMWISERKLELQERFLELYPEIDMCFSACIVEFEATATQVEHPSWNDGRNRIIDIIDLLYDNPIATFSNCFYRSPAFQDTLASPDRTTGYDWLCTLKIASSHQIGFLAEPSTLYRVHRNGTWSGMSRQQQRRAIRQTLRSFLQSDTSGIKPFIQDAMRNIP